jgi:hypothetical protein
MAVLKSILYKKAAGKFNLWHEYIIF